jgi:hypothetical protein
MPRFGAENIPNALKEQFLREIYREGMFNNDPMNRYPQEFEQDNYIRGPEMQYGSINEPVRNERIQGGVYDDTKSDAQGRKDSRRRAEGYAYSKTPELVPLHRNQSPIQDEQSEIIPPMTRNSLRDAYNQLPQGNPNIQYPGTVMPDPFSSPQMDQLMQFYTNEDI